MKYICLGYMDEKLWDTMSDGERNTFMDECFAYDDILRENDKCFAGSVKTSQLVDFVVL